MLLESCIKLVPAPHILLNLDSRDLFTVRTGAAFNRNLYSTPCFALAGNPHKDKQITTLFCLSKLPFVVL